MPVWFVAKCGYHILNKSWGKLNMGIEAEKKKRYWNYLSKSVLLKQKKKKLKGLNEADMSDVRRYIHLFDITTLYATFFLKRLCYFMLLS